ncbi:Eco57I restriction-modification methylase [Mesomycoplasma conjunctivae]|nr:Eco57I restriction-modification methylase [Mesomycoplasma conjunctivae]VEU66418.1 Eco57I restriction-modification methylase [Mesomycoplasma conjunctivae]
MNIPITKFKKQFDYIMSNPPYQINLPTSEEQIIKNAAPMYNYFILAAWEFARCFAFLTPSTWLVSKAPINKYLIDLVKNNVRAVGIFSNLRPLFTNIGIGSEISFVIVDKKIKKKKKKRTIFFENEKKH